MDSRSGGGAGNTACSGEVPLRQGDTGGMESS